MIKQEVIILLQKTHSQLEHAPTITEFMHINALHSTSTIYHNFNSYSDACAAAGFLNPGIRRPSPQNKQQVLDDIIMLREKLGHIPTWVEYNLLGKFAVITTRNLFGSFHKAKLAAGFQLPQDNWSLDSVSDCDGAWLSGFVEGEGTFGIKTYQTRPALQLNFSIAQRSDRPQSILEATRILGLDSSFISYNKTYCSHRMKYYLPSMALKVVQIPILAQRICPFFLRFPLRGKKREDFRLFNAATILLWHKYQSTGRTHYTHEQIYALSNLSQMSSLIKLPNVTLANIKSMMQK